MSKFRIRVRVQNLELEIDGSREDAPLLANAVGNQLAGLIMPASQAIAPEALETDVVVERTPTESATAKARRSSRKRTTKTTNASADSDGETLDWRHDPGRWGSPQQGWKTSQKAMWLLYVTKNELSKGELSARQIADTFNKHFKQSKTILTHNVQRDLGKLKVGKESPVAEDTSASPSRWYLTDAGDVAAANLVKEARGLTPAAG